MLKRLFVGLLALSMVLVCFASCGQTADGGKETKSETQKAQQTETTVETTIPEATYDVPASLDYHGSEFTILTCDGENPTTDFYWTSFDEHELNGDLLNDAIFSRNEAVQEDLGITIVLDTSADLIDTAAYKNSVTGGSKDFDLGIWIDRFALSLAMDGMVIPVSTLDAEYVDLSKPWWYQSVNKDLSIGGKLYFAGGYFNIDLFGGMQVMLFNQDIVESKDLANPYQLVDEGKWTFDAMYEMMEQAVEDLDGNDKMDDTDMWGAVYNGSQWHNNFIACSGESYIKKDANDMPYLNAIGNATIIDMLDMVLLDICSKDVAFNVSDSTHFSTGHIYENEVNMFANGNCLFAGTCATYMGSMRRVDMDYGIIPFPSYTEHEKAEDYLSYITGLVAHIVPTTCDDTARTSAVLESMAYHSYTEVIPKFVEQVLQLKNVRDDKSGEMLKIMNNNLTLELGQTYWFDQVCGSAMSTIIQKGTGIYQSTFQEKEAVINAALEKTVTAFEKIGQ